jgi:DNA replication protein DnaC
MIVTSNKPFSACGKIFDDDIAATTMIDRLLHHAEILSVKGESYRLGGKDLHARPTGAPPTSPNSPTIRI